MQYLFYPPKCHWFCALNPVLNKHCETEIIDSLPSFCNYISLQVLLQPSPSSSGEQWSRVSDVQIMVAPKGEIPAKNMSLHSFLSYPLLAERKHLAQNCSGTSTPVQRLPCNRAIPWSQYWTLLLEKRVPWL